MPKRKGPTYYGVRVGHHPGVYDTWEECSKQVTGFPGNKFKSFPTRAEAEEYVQEYLKCSQGPVKGSSTPDVQSKPCTAFIPKPLKVTAPESQGPIRDSNAFSEGAKIDHSKLFKLVEEHGEQFVAFESITNFDRYCDWLWQSKGQRTREVFNGSMTISSPIVHSDHIEALKGNTLPSKPDEEDQQGRPSELPRETGEFIYFKDEDKLDRFLAPFFSKNSFLNPKPNEQLGFPNHNSTLQRSSGRELADGYGQRETLPLDKGVYQVEFDGASKGNPGKAGAGALIRCPHGVVILELTEFLGVATNNEAEYRSLLLGLTGALSLGIQRVKVQGDSKLVCLQVCKVWKVGKEHLQPLFNQVMELKKQFEEFSIVHVERELNPAADALANEAVYNAGSERRLNPIPKCCQQDTLDLANLY